MTKKSKYIVKGLNSLCRGLGIQLSNFRDPRIRKGLDSAKGFSWDNGTQKKFQIKKLTKVFPLANKAEILPLSDYLSQ